MYYTILMQECETAQRMEKYILSYPFGIPLPLSVLFWFVLWQLSY